MAPRRHPLIAALAAVGALAGGAIALAAGDEPETARPLVLSGTVEGLYPGATLHLPVLAANPNARPVVITSLATTVTSAPTGCPADALQPGGLGEPLSVAANGSALGRIPVTMRTDAPNDCQGATFALAFRALGEGEGTPVAPPGAPPAAVPGGRPAPSAAPACRKVRIKVKVRITSRKRTGRRRVRYRYRTKTVCRHPPTTICRKVRITRRSGRSVRKLVCRPARRPTRKAATR